MLPIEEYIGGMEETLDGLDELMKGRNGERLTQLSELMGALNLSLSAADVAALDGASA